MTTSPKMSDREQEIRARAEAATASMSRGRRLLAEKTFRELEATHWRRLGIEPPQEQAPEEAR